jgi:hypothetical protein
MDQINDHAQRRATIADAKAVIAKHQARIANVRANGHYPKHSIEGAQRDVEVAILELDIAKACLSIAELRTELPPIQA